MSQKEQANLMSVLKCLLNQSNLTGNALAKEINLPTPTVHRLMSGDVSDPRISTLTLIADYFGVTIEQLLGRAELDEKLKIQPAMSIPELTVNEARDYKNYLTAPAHWLRWQAQDYALDYTNIFSVLIKNNIYEPVFYSGTSIIINPNAQPESGDYVLISFKGDAAAVLKKYSAEGRHKYFHPLAADLKTIAFDPKEAKILGVVIESHKIFKN